MRSLVAQQFQVARQVLAHGLVPIIEPEVNIKSADRDAADRILLDEILEELDGIPDGQQVMLKLSIPAEAGLFEPLVDHPKVLRVVALSGGFSRAEACRELAQNPGMIASFSRALALRPAPRPERRGVQPHARHRDRRNLPGVDREGAGLALEAEGGSGRLRLRPASPRWLARSGFKQALAVPLATRTGRAPLSSVDLAGAAIQVRRILSRPRPHAAAPIRGQRLSSTI